MSIFVKNNSAQDITEDKPGLGHFVIPAGERIEIVDFIQEAELPNKDKVKYVHTTARAIAESLVRDRGRNDLEVQLEGDDAVEEKEVKKAGPVLVEKKKEEVKKEEEKKPEKKKEEVKP